MAARSIAVLTWMSIAVAILTGRGDLASAELIPCITPRCKHEYWRQVIKPEYMFEFDIGASTLKRAPE